MEYIELIIIGIYTIVYLIVFIIQKAQFTKLKETNKSMKDFMDIFDIDEIKKYVELKTENAQMKAANFIADSDEVKKMGDSMIDDIRKEAVTLLDDQIKLEYLELFNQAAMVLDNMELKDREKTIEDIFPTNKEKFTKYFASCDARSN